MSDFDTSPAETKASVSEFLRNFNSFKDDVSKRMTEMTTRIERLDRKSADTRRPALATRAAEDTPHRKAFGSYIRQGDEDHFKALGLEGKGYNTAVAAEGGFLVDPQTSEMVSHVLRSGASIRGVSRVVQVDASAYDVLVDHGDIGAGWITETGGGGAELTPRSTASPCSCTSSRPRPRPRSASSTTPPSTWRPGSPSASPTASCARSRTPSSTATGSTSRGLPDQAHGGRRRLVLGQYRLCRHRHRAAISTPTRRATRWSTSSIRSARSTARAPSS